MLNTKSCKKKKILYALIMSVLVLETPFGAYAQEETAVSPVSSEDSSLDHQAKQNDFNFKEITVSSERLRKKTPSPFGDYAGGQVAKSARVGMLGNANIFDTPFNITSYTDKTMEDQQARTIYDVLMNDSSVRFTTSSGHINENYNIRGFDVNAQDLGLNGMYGIAPIAHVPTEFVERVEVLKGPSALLNGMPPGGSVGGTINLVTKRALDEPLTRITTDYTSGSQEGLHLDIGRRFGGNKEWGVRFNGVYRDGDTGVSGQDKKRTLGTLGVDYRGESWRASLDVFDSQEKTAGGTAMMVNFQSAVTAIPKAPAGDTNAFAGTYGNTSNKGAMFQGELDVNKNLAAYWGLGYLNYSYEGFINSTHARNVDALGNFSGYTTHIRGYVDTFAAEAGLRGSFKTGDALHKVVFGTNFLQLESGSTYTQSSTYLSNIYHPVTPILAVDPGSAPKTAETTLTGIALADTLSFNKDKYNLTLGIRSQRVESKSFNKTTGALTARYDKSALTPAVALVVKPWNKPISLYANYIEGLSQGSTVTDTNASNYGEVFAPFKTQQSEVGVKWDSGNYANTLSFFQVTKPSVIKDNRTNTYSEDGEQQSRGVEWNVFGKVSDTVRVLGGVSFLRGEQIKTAGGIYDGKTVYGTPKWKGNIGFEFDALGVPGLSFTTRAVYTGSQYANAANTQKIPSWVRYDAGARYKTTLEGHIATFRFNVENLLNKNYWAGTFTDGYLTLGSGRTYKVSLSIDF